MPQHPKCWIHSHEWLHFLMALLEAAAKNQMAPVISAFSISAQDPRDSASTINTGALKRSPAQALHTAEEQWLRNLLFFSGSKFVESCWLLP